MIAEVRDAAGVGNQTVPALLVFRFDHQGQQLVDGGLLRLLLIKSVEHDQAHHCPSLLGSGIG